MAKDSPSSAEVKTKDLPAFVLVPLPGGVSTKPVNLSRVVFDIPVGQRWAQVSGGPLCIPGGQLNWDAGRFDSSSNLLADEFRRNFRSAGFQSGTDNLFDSATESSGEYSVGARVKSIDAKFCYWPPGKFGAELLKGEINFTIDWQIYSRLQRKIIATTTTSGSITYPKFSTVKMDTMIAQAFGVNAAKLSMNDDFRKIFVIDTTPSATVQNNPQTTNQIVLSGGPAAARTIGEASGSVVAILAGDGLGTGFLVSSDGYVITNEHVVGKETKVRIRWSDGFESDGEVIRTHKARDVALIRTNPHGRQPLALHRGTAAAGSTVFAVGTPLDLKFQGTVTKGIVSANRIFDGFSFIQSDVGVSHGNSGGPLLDEKGAVVGITDWGHREDGEPANLNFFIPIGDALDFLNLKPAA
jgi:serine protease Do